MTYRHFLLCLKLQKQRYENISSSRQYCSQTRRDNSCQIPCKCSVKFSRGRAFSGTRDHITRPTVDLFTVSGATLQDGGKHTKLHLSGSSMPNNLSHGFYELQRQDAQQNVLPMKYLRRKIEILCDIVEKVHCFMPTCSHMDIKITDTE